MHSLSVFKRDNSHLELNFQEGCHFLGLGVVFLVVDEVFGSVLVGSQLEDVLTAVMAAFKRTD